MVTAETSSEPGYQEGTGYCGYTSDTVETRMNTGFPRFRLSYARCRPAVHAVFNGYFTLWCILSIFGKQKIPLKPAVHAVLKILLDNQGVYE